jgi:hypothetical protein
LRKDFRQPKGYSRCETRDRRCAIVVNEPATDWANARGFLPVLDLSVDQPFQRTILVDKDLERIGDEVPVSAISIPIAMTRIRTRTMRFGRVLGGGAGLQTRTARQS